MIRERAERDQREKEALESLKMKLETDKQKIEDDLEAERSLGLDKDAQLERSKKRETELEEDAAAFQADLDTLDSQLDRVMINHKATEEKYEALCEAFDEAANHIAHFEAGQKEWKMREEELSQSLKIAEEKLEGLQAECDQLKKLSEDSRRLLSEREENLVRARERMETAISDLETKLASEVRNRCVPCFIFISSLFMWSTAISGKRGRIALKTRLVKRMSNSRRWLVRQQSILP